MVAILCVDNRMGYLFNRRRVSHDRVLNSWLAQHIGTGKLWLREYSARLFDGLCDVLVDENYLERAEKGDYCFVEDNKIEGYHERIEELIVCRWNRDYPSDVKLDDTLYRDWQRSVLAEIVGSSHEKITIESWGKVNE